MQVTFADFEENYNSLIKLLAQNPQLLESGQLECFNNQFPLQDNGEILEHLQLAVKEDFPPLFADPSVIVKSLQGSLTDYCAPAFYLTVPLDAYENNVIYVNEKNKETPKNQGFFKIKCGWQDLNLHVGDTRT